MNFTGVEATSSSEVETFDDGLPSAPSRVRVNQYKSELLLSPSHAVAEPHAQSASILYSNYLTGRSSHEEPVKTHCCRGLWRRLRDYYSLKNLKWDILWKKGSVQSAIQKGVAALASVLTTTGVSLYLGFPDASMVMIAGISAHITIENTMGDTTAKALNRFIGTAVGGAFCLLQLMLITLGFSHVPEDALGTRSKLVNPFTVDYNYIYLIVLFVLIPMNAVLWAMWSELRPTKSNYLFALYCAITSTITLASTMGTLNMKKLLIGRVFGVLIGIFISMMTKQLIFPRRTRSVMINAFSDSLYKTSALILPLLQLEMFGFQTYPGNYTVFADRVFKYNCVVDEIVLEYKCDTERYELTDTPSFTAWFDKTEVQSYTELWSEFHNQLAGVRQRMTKVSDELNGHKYEWFDLTQCLKTKRRVRTNLFAECQKSMLSFIEILMGIFFSFDMQLAATDMANAGVSSELRLHALVSDFKLNDYFTPKIRDMDDKLLKVENNNLEGLVQLLKVKFAVTGSYFTDADYHLLAHCSFEEYDVRSEWMYNNAMKTCLSSYSEYLSICGFLVVQIVVVLSLWLTNYESMQTVSTHAYLWQCHSDLTKQISEFTKMRIARRGEFSQLFSDLYRVASNYEDGADSYAVKVDTEKLVQNIDTHFGLSLQSEFRDRMRIGASTLNKEDREYIRSKLMHTLVMSYWHGYFLAGGKIHAINKWLEVLSMESHKLIVNLSELLMSVYGKNYVGNLKDDTQKV